MDSCTNTSFYQQFQLYDTDSKQIHIKSWTSNTLNISYSCWTDYSILILHTKVLLFGTIWSCIMKHILLRNDTYCNVTKSLDFLRCSFVRYCPLPEVYLITHNIWELVPALVFRPWQKLFLLLWLRFTIRFRLNALSINKLNTRPQAVRGKKVPSISDTYSVSIFRCRKQTSMVDHFK